jgi:hypothetical protein
MNPRPRPLGSRAAVPTPHGGHHADHPHRDTTIPAADDGAGVSPAAVGRFGRVPARWLEDPGVGVDELAVLTALAVHTNGDGVCVVRQRTLANLLQRSREWVCRVLARLCEPGGFVEKERRADQEARNGATGEAVLVRIMARRGGLSSAWMGG